jgi:hypothetical protein
VLGADGDVLAYFGSDPAELDRGRDGCGAAVLVWVEGEY